MSNMKDHDCGKNRCRVMSVICDRIAAGESLRSIEDDYEFCRGTMDSLRHVVREKTIYVVMAHSQCPDGGDSWFVAAYFDMALALHHARLAGPEAERILALYHTEYGPQTPVSKYDERVTPVTADVVTYSVTEHEIQEEAPE